MKKILSNKLSFFILVVAIVSITTAFAYSYLAENVGFTPTDDTWDVDNTKDALDSLHSLFSCDDSEIGTVWEFPQWDAGYTFFAPCYGNYKLETWGGQGGSYSSSIRGGYGGYASGTINLKGNEKLYIYVGGQGLLGSGKSFSRAGGYNGGGSASVTYSQSLYAGSGGGATHIAVVSGLLSTLESNKNAVIIVAGGGGGSGWYSSTNYGSGGDGGGYQGKNGTSYLNTNVGTGGTQDGPGFTSSYPDNGKGSFGQGAISSGSIYAGAGGGWYGGGLPSSNANGAGGGSGYIGNNRLFDKAMFCYNCSESDDQGTYTTSTYGTTNHGDERNSECSSGYSDTPISKCAKTGNGHARITFLGS